MNIRPANPSDWAALAELLTVAGLPLAGAREHLPGFVLAFEDDHLVGVAGLERYGTTALLRSLAVAPEQRGTGLGQELVRLLLDQAYDKGIRTVTLLTTTADRFFPRFGFRRVDRSDFPADLQASAELRGACPASSVAMLLDLSMPATLVRPAVEADLPAITRIYNQGIEDRSTLETELRSVEERKTWLHGHQERHPVLVAVRRGEVLGWASLNQFNPRHAYRFVADLSVYVERDERGTGVGSALMVGLIERARPLGYHKIVLTTFTTMTAAIKLYEKFGFRTVGDYREQGQLDGRWVDTRIMELLI
ncbi:MAG TPA: arsinothricin resistance N-acetyltransferase ArsN1 family A [Symbiobacteriaceae bacterium]|nr:arsinothricin resistance N-acetyltransferase ArsN1 family A [Symbiobacteriaceae bacterium]